MADITVLVDYGAGNLRSVHNALNIVGADVTVTADPAKLRDAARIVLPGVGAYQTCADGLRAIDGLAEIMEQRVMGAGVPFMGICVGMQLMAEYGLENGMHKGLGWVAGAVEKIAPASQIRVPHMGWNCVTPVGPPSLIEAGEAYFLHSYAYRYAHSNAVRAVTDHGGEVVAAIQAGSALGVQFHPEKSQAYGLNLLARFVEWNP